MRNHRYIFDSAQDTFRKSAVSLRLFVRKALRYLVVSVALAMVWYLLFALFMNTDVEKRLKAENRAYAAAYQNLKDNMNMLSAVVGGLEYRDNEIYKAIFQSSVPELPADVSALTEDEVGDEQVAKFISQKVESALKGAAMVDENFRKVFEKLLAEDVPMPPATAPVESFTVARAGASLGPHISPFLKMEVAHNGLDIISPAGSAVIAAADGVVVEVTRSAQGEGNAVTLSHPGGYETRYSHLGSINVKKGQKVRHGYKIGTIGISGVSYAPHLHYEVRRDAVLCDPVNYMFVSVTPSEYLGLQLVTRSTRKSLD